MENKIIFYARVSSREQNLDRQIEAFRKLGAEERDIITDKQSGKSLDRPGYLALKNTMLRSGDTLVIKSLDRLSRNKTDIWNELMYFRAHNIRLKIVDLPTTMTELPEGQTWVFDMVNNLLIEVIGTIAEQERQAIRQRQREGIDAALSKGTKFGRPAVPIPDNFDEVVARWRAGEITARAAMKIMGMSKSTFYKLIRL